MEIEEVPPPKQPPLLPNEAPSSPLPIRGGGVTPEELFAACRFEEASTLAQAQLAAWHEEKASSPRSSSPDHRHIVEISPTCSIALEGTCGPNDRLASLLLQCAFELRRDYELEAFAHHYSTLHKPLPFPVALTWLGLRLARGDYEEVQAILWRLYEVLRDTPPEATPSSPLMQVKVLDLLVTRALLPMGDIATAAELVRADTRLTPQQRKVLEGKCIAAEKSWRASVPGGGHTTTTNGPPLPHRDQEEALASVFDSGRGSLVGAGVLGGEVAGGDTRSWSLVSASSAWVMNVTKKAGALQSRAAAMAGSLSARRSALALLTLLPFCTWLTQAFLPSSIPPIQSSQAVTSKLNKFNKFLTCLNSAILPLDSSEAPLLPPTDQAKAKANIVITDITPTDLRIAADVCIEAFFGRADRNPIRNLQLQSLLDEQIKDLASRYRRTSNNRMLKAVDAQGNMLGFVEVGLTQGTKYGMPRGVPERDFRPCLSNLAVRRGERRAGIGTRLAQVCEDTVTQWGFDEIILQVEEDNMAARQLYRGLGYRELFVDRGARKYDIAGMSIKSVPVSKITMRKILAKPNPVQQLLSNFFPQAPR